MLLPFLWQHAAHYIYAVGVASVHGSNPPSPLSANCWEAELDVSMDVVNKIPPTVNDHWKSHCKTSKTPKIMACFHQNKSDGNF